MVLHCGTIYVAPFMCYTVAPLVYVANKIVIKPFSPVPKKRVINFTTAMGILYGPGNRLGTIVILTILHCCCLLLCIINFLLRYI